MFVNFGDLCKEPTLLNTLGGDSVLRYLVLAVVTVVSGDALDV